MISFGIVQVILVRLIIKQIFQRVFSRIDERCNICTWIGSKISVVISVRLFYYSYRDSCIRFRERI